jgi:hypothetical protein
MRHVPDGIDVDQRADAGDHQQHHNGQPVHQEIAADVDGAALYPGEVVLHVGRVEIAHGGDGLQHPEKGKKHAADRNGVDQALGKPASEEAVDQEARQREDWYEPELHRS